MKEAKELCNRLFQWVLRLSPYDSWDKLQSPSNPELDKQEKWID